MSRSSSLRLALAATVFALAGCARSVIPLDDAGTHVVAPTNLRLIAPLSTATVTSRRPLLHWRLGAGDDGAQIELCRDRACTQRLTTLDAVGSRAAPASDLPTGVVYWRARGRSHGALDAATSPTWHFTVGARSAAVNTSWGTTLDVDGDGFADVIVSEPGAHGDALGHGYVFLGSATGLATVPATTLPGTASRYSAIGDVDGDGYGDVLEVSDSSPGRRSLAVYRSGPTGLATTPALTLAQPIGADGDFGESVAGADDVDGDGFADLVVGDDGPHSPGMAFVFLGSEAGLSSAPSMRFAYPDAPMGSLLTYLANAGDFDGDGFGDIVISAVDLPGTTSATVFLGSATGLSLAHAVSLDRAPGVPFTAAFNMEVTSLGDVDGDGRCDVGVLPIRGSDVGLHANERLDVYLGTGALMASTPATSLALIDATSVFSAGDIDGDGFADVLAQGVDHLSSLPYVTLYRGSGAGLAAVPSTALTLRIPPGGLLGGVSVAGVGDVQGDGFADVVVGVPLSGFEPGHAWLYPGSAGGLAATPTANLTGADGSFGSAVARGGTRRVAATRFAVAPRARAPHS